MPTINPSQSLVLINKQNGLVIIPAATPLTRLNYFDGKFLRAQDLKVEQDYLRQLVRESNQAGGPGVANGFDLTEGAGDELNISPGLAIDPQGRVLLLPQAISVGAQELIDKSRDLERLFGKSTVSDSADFGDCEFHSEDPPLDLHQAGDLFLIVVSSAEAFCGEEAVYGKLCEEACVTSTDRPYIIEGVTIRAIPMGLLTPLPNSRARSLTQTHLRSRVASAYFEDERKRVASLISRFGLEQKTWCLGAGGQGGSGVAIGVIARAGSATVFLDPWTARRERIDSPARRYWQWRMMMRPWDVFLAQVLQFQCQLHDVFRRTPAFAKEVDEYGGARGVINEAATTIADLREFYTTTTERFTALRVNLEEAITFQGGLTRLTDLNKKLVTVSQTLGQLPQDEFLLNHGIVEVPSAGYLPVTPGASATVNQQVRRLMGGGVDLRFCVVRPDYVAHALEEAQHMERISLMQGLDDPNNKPQVDILVPNGEILEQKQLSSGRGFEATVNLGERLFGFETAQQFFGVQPQTRNFRGVARTEALSSGGGAFYLSCEQHVNLFELAVYNQNLIEATSRPVERTSEAFEVGRISDTIGEVVPRGETLLLPTRPYAGLWVSISCERNVFDLKVGDTSNFNASAVVGMPADKSPLVQVDFNGAIRVTSAATTSGNARTVRGHIEDATLAGIGPIFGAASRQRSIVDLDVEITLRNESAIEIVLTHPKVITTLSANWGKQPLEATASIVLNQNQSVGKLFGFPVASAPVVQATLKENEDVLSIKNSNHIEALGALQLVGTALKDIAFADTKARLLFPPPPKPIDELLVRGTMDWVLFHRRRNKKCSVEIVQPPPPPPRRYFLVLMHLQEVGQLNSVREALHTSSAAGDALIQRIGFRPVDIVEFDSGAATLVSSLAEIQTDWQAKSPGNLLEYGAIASSGAVAGEGNAIAQSRLGRVEQIVSAISHPVQNATFEVVATVPKPLVFPDTDGTIVMVTAQEVTTICHTVYWAANDEKLSAALALIRAGKIGEAIGRLTSIGNVQFQRDQVVVSDAQSLNNVATKWKELGGSAFLSAVAMATSATQAEETRYKEQTKLIGNAIRHAMGEAPVDAVPDVVRTASALPTQCPTFSIITVKPVATVCHQVFRASPQFFASKKSFEEAVELIGRGDLSLAIKQCGLTSLGTVLFKPDTAEVSDSASLSRIKPLWDAHGGGQLGMTVVVVKFVPHSHNDLALAQARVISAAIGPSLEEPFEWTTPELPKAPVDCPMFSIVVPVTTVKPATTVCHTVYRARSVEHFEKAVELLQTMGTGNIHQVVTSLELIHLGDALFEEQSAHVFGDGQALNDVKHEWDQQGGGQVIRAAVVYRLPPQDEQSRQDQAKEIAKQLNHGRDITDSIFQVVKVQTAVTLPTACPAFTILLPLVITIIQRECMTVYVTGNRGEYFSAVQALDFLGTTHGNTFINVNDPEWAEVADVSFSANTVNPLDGSLDDMLEKWQELKGQTVLFATVVCHKSTTPHQGVADQAESIRAKIGSAPGATTTVDLRSVDDSVVFPTDCRAFLMILTKASSD